MMVVGPVMEESNTRSIIISPRRPSTRIPSPSLYWHRGLQPTNQPTLGLHSYSEGQESRVAWVSDISNAGGVTYLASGAYNKWSDKWNVCWGFAIGGVEIYGLISIKVWASIQLEYIIWIATVLMRKWIFGFLTRSINHSLIRYSTHLHTRFWCGHTLGCPSSYTPSCYKSSGCTCSLQDTYALQYQHNCRGLGRGTSRWWWWWCWVLGWR